MDRYGEAKYAIVGTEFLGLLQQKRRHERGDGNDFVAVDAVLTLQASAEIMAGDRVLIDNAAEDKYTAYSSDPVYDGAGGVLAHSVSLIKIKSR